MTISAFRYIVAGLFIFGIVWFFHSCSKPDKTTMTPKKTSGLTEEMKADGIQFRDSIMFQIQARKIINPPFPTSVVYEVARKDHDLSTELLKKSLAACENVSDTTLLSMHKDMQLHYRREYQEGLRLYLSGQERMDHADMLRGQQLCDDFLDWFESEVKKRK